MHCKIKFIANFYDVKKGFIMNKYYIWVKVFKNGLRNFVEDNL